MHADTNQEMSHAEDTTETHTDGNLRSPSHKGDNPVSDNKKENAKKQQSWKNLIVFTLLVLSIVVPIRMFVAKPFIVSGTSMYPTFDSWHYLIVDQLSYHFHAPERGDVITFRFPQNDSLFLIKRIIGLPNETILLNGTTTEIINKAHPDGMILNEKYVKPENAMGASMRIHLGNNEYFVMGDNRKVSADSRYWGPLERSRIIGRAYLRLFPFTKIGILPGSIKDYK